MFEILQNIIREQGQGPIVENNEIPNEHNETVMKEAENSITQGFKEMAEKNPQQLQSLMDSGDHVDASHPAVSNIANNFAGNIASKLGINASTAKSIAMMVIPMVISKFINKAKDPNDKSIGLQDILGGLTGGGGLGGVLGKLGL